MSVHRTGLLLLLITGLAAGCASGPDSSNDVPVESLPNPIVAPTTPGSVPVTSLVLLSTTNLQDVDGSGPATQLPFAAYLYARPYPAPKWERGAFEFLLYPASAPMSQGIPTSEPLATWSWDAEESWMLRSENLVGPFYTFMIDLDQRSISVDDVRGFQFLVRFTPAAGGAPVRSAVKNVWCQ